MIDIQGAQFDHTELSSGTFPTGSSLDRAPVSKSLGLDEMTIEAAVRAFLLGIMHEQSSPLGALLANLSLAGDGLYDVLDGDHAIDASVAGPLRILQKDLSDALSIVERLTKMGERIKRIAAKAEVAEHDLKELLPLAVTVGRAYGGCSVSLRYSSEGKVDSHHGMDFESPDWPIQTNGLDFVCSLIRTMRLLVNRSNSDLRSIDIVVERKGETISITLEPQFRESSLRSAQDSSKVTSIDDSSKIDAWFGGTNFRLVRASIQEGRCVILESTCPMSAFSKRKERFTHHSR